MKKRIMLCLLAVIFVVNTVTVFAESASITVNVTSKGRNVTITGNLSSGEGKNISVEVHDPKQNYAYVNQIKSGASGNFTINFSLRDNAPYGLYFVIIGAEGVQSPVYDLFSYMDGDEPEPAVITVNVTNTGRDVSISGNITSGEGKNISVEVHDPKQSTVYESQVTSGAGGSFTVNFSLSENAIHGLYFVIINAEGVQDTVYDLFSYMGEETPEPEPEPGTDTIAATVTNTGKNVSITGNITSGEGKNISVNVKDKNGSSVYSSQTTSTEGGSFSFSFTLSETAAEGQYNVTLSGDGVSTPLSLNFTYSKETEGEPYDYYLEKISDNKYLFIPKYNGVYEFESEGDISLSVDENGVVKEVEPTSVLKYPEKYYIEVEDNCTVSVKKTGNYKGEKSFESNGYYSKMSDGASLYSGENKVYSGVTTWIYADGIVYFNENGLKAYDAQTGEAETLLTGVKPYFIVSDGSAVYFSDRLKNGKIYVYKDGEKTLVCHDSASWLRIQDNYIYYFNLLDGGKLYRVEKNAVNKQSGTIVTQTNAETAAETNSETEAETITEEESETNAEPADETEIETEPETSLEPGMETESETETEINNEPADETEAEPETETDIKAETKETV